MSRKDELALLLGDRPSLPRSGVARARLRRARPLVTVTQLPLPALLVVLTFMDFAPRRNWDWSWVAGSIVILLVCGWHWWTRRHRPHTWPRASAWMSGLAGLYIAVGLTNPSRGLETSDRNQAVPAVVQYLLLAVGVPVATWAAWRLGRIARRIVLEPFTLELADSPLELHFPSRVDRKQVLRIRQHMLLHPQGMAWLDDIGPVELTPGPAVRFEVLGEVWAFPTDQGAELAQVIDRRRPVPAPSQRPVRRPDNREPDQHTPEKINQLRRDANRRVLAAVKELTDNPIAGSPTAVAALRQTCDEVIGELLDASDLLSDNGRRLLRHDAARIQRLRDHHCGSATGPAIPFPPQRG